MDLLSESDNKKDGLFVKLHSNMGDVKTEINRFMASAEDVINSVCLEKRELIEELAESVRKLEVQEGIIGQHIDDKDDLEKHIAVLVSKNEVLMLGNETLNGENLVLKADNKKLVAQIDDKDLIIKQLKGN